MAKRSMLFLVLFIVKPWLIFVRETIRILRQMLKSLFLSERKLLKAILGVKLKYMKDVSIT